MSTEHDLSGLAHGAATEKVREARNVRLANRRKVGKTSKACPGCGVSTNRWNGRPATEVCDDCLALLWEAEDRRAEDEARKKAPGNEYLRIPVPKWSTTPAWPQWYVSRSNLREERDAFESALANLIYKLLEDRVIPDSKVWNYEGRLVPEPRRGDSTGPVYRVAAPAGTGDLIEALDASAQVYLKALYDEGKEAGRSLLTQLAIGEITVDQLNDTGRK